jgi:hypothetical protein
MSEDFIFKHRNRLKNHFVNVSKVLLYGYKSLSDGAKITFQVIDGFDWEDKETGDSKGYVFPSTEMIAKIRNTTERTIRRHITELIGAKLITRQRRKYRASVLFIETVSDKEADTYFDLLKNNRKKTGEEKSVVNSRTDKNVRSEQGGEKTKMSVLFKKENEVKENEINVNVDLHRLEEKNYKKPERGVNGLDSVSNILKQFKLKIPPRPNIRKPDEYAKRDFIAEELARDFNDQKSLGCYRTIAEKVPSGVIHEIRSSIRETYRNRKVRQSRGAIFVSVVKKYCEGKGIELDFNQPQDDYEKPPAFS